MKTGTRLLISAAGIGIIGLGAYWVRVRGLEREPSSTNATSSSIQFATRQSLSLDKHTSSMRAELFAPAVANANANANANDALLVFLQGNDEPDDRIAYSAEVGDALERKGIATLSIAFDVSPSFKLRRAAAEVAAIIDEVTKQHEVAKARRGRIVLSGRGVGAWMAAMLALDKRLFEQNAPGFDTKKIAGVIGLRGVYDLSSAGLDGLPDHGFYASNSEDGENNRRDTSPIAFARADAPPFLLLAGGEDKNKNLPRLNRLFALTLEAKGMAPSNVERHIAPFNDEHSLTHWAQRESAGKSDLGDLVVSFITNGPQPLPVESHYGIRQRWTSRPPFDNEEFRKDKSKVSTHPVEPSFVSTLMLLFERFPSELNVLPGKTYESIDLLDYLSSRPDSEVGKGDYLTVTNIRSEKQYFKRDDLVKAKAVIVVGMDDETNLYRLFGWYQLRQAYSWKKGDEPQPPMIRPLGAFLHFPSSSSGAPLPPHLRNKSYAPFGLTPKSFQWTEADPLAAVRQLEGGLRDAMLGEQGCLKCHSWRGTGAKAHHILAADGKPGGGFALPLEEYPTEVLRRFLFDQDAVAKSFDVSPLRVEPKAAKELFDLVVAK